MPSVKKLLLKKPPKPVRFQGSTQDYLDSLPRCVYPGCEEPGSHPHHVTYDPEEIQHLCPKHHEDITIINGQQGRRVRHQLSNRHRRFLWFQFLQGKKKPRRTKLAMEYISEWYQPPRRLS